MTVGELMDELAKYDRGQYVEIVLRSRDYPTGASLFIQAVKDRPPWHPSGAANENLVGILAHADNKVMPDATVWPSVAKPYTPPPGTVGPDGGFVIPGHLVTHYKWDGVSPMATLPDAADAPHVVEGERMTFRVGDQVVKNPERWRGSDFDEWGAGDGVGVVVELTDATTVDVRWANGRCYQRVDELLPHVVEGGR